MNKKTKPVNDITDFTVSSENWKKKKIDEININSKLPVPYSPIAVVPNCKVIPSSNLINIHHESRLAAISHIKQMNPKYRNVIIPVLPDSIKKF